ncbi:hypothetical protein BZL42_04090 [Pseudomonas indica]|nr:SymE family type I addiction module toxin [Pseudomonas indica]PAU63672.1 hypothetical protein BZL42_04090 [Pseudomonas indica]
MPIIGRLHPELNVSLPSLLGEQLHVGDRGIPGIKLRGYWLQQVGFEVNERIRIRVMQGCLVITAE